MGRDCYAVLLTLTFLQAEQAGRHIVKDHRTEFFGQVVGWLKTGNENMQSSSLKVVILV